MTSSENEALTLPSLFIIRQKVKITSSAVKSEPLENFTSLRRSKTQLWSSSAFQDLARSGLMLLFWSDAPSVEKMCSARALFDETS